MKKKNLLYLSSFALILLGYQNCGQSLLTKDGGSQDSSSQASSGYQEEFKISSPVALLSYEQVFKSMASVTGVPLNNGAVNNEFNQRSGLFAANFDVKNVNSPMLMGIANLASVFCNQMLNTEASAQDANRKFFNGVNFNAGVNSYSQSLYESSLNKMALSFWGRSPSSVELNNLNAGRTEFLADYTTAEINNSASTRNLALYACTAMLSSSDSYTF